MAVPSITLISLVSGSPSKFALLEWQMSRQTYAQPLEWIVVAPQGSKIVCTKNQILIPFEEGESSDALIEAASLASNARIVFVDDESYYSPQYLDIYAGALRTKQAVIGKGYKKYSVFSEELETVISGTSITQIGCVVEVAESLILDNCSAEALGRLKTSVLSLYTNGLHLRLDYTEAPEPEVSTSALVTATHGDSQMRDKCIAMRDLLLAEAISNSLENEDEGADEDEDDIVTEVNTEEADDECLDGPTD